MPQKRNRAEETDAVDSSSSSDMEAEFDEPTKNHDGDDGHPQDKENENELTSARTTAAVTNNNGSAKKQTTQKASIISPQLLQVYYSRLFPYHLLYEWLSYNPALCSSLLRGETKHVPSSYSSSSNNKTFAHREFSFTVEISPGEETYMRYQSYKDQAEFEAAVRKRNPGKIDIGAVFSHPPKDRHALQGSKERKLEPRQRELVFDVDLTDYDSVRKCGCSSANICLKCWKMMGMAIKVMDVGLREDFGFQNIAWFYSGRRGVHAWVCDESARTLSDAGRSAVASYFEVSC
jgi:Eukaryotic-type DNA primase, catalytic (small) subunit